MGSAEHAAAIGEEGRRRVGQLRTAGHDEALPLTERLIAALPGSRVIWIVAWSLIVVARPFVAGAILVASGRAAEARTVIEVHLPHNLVLAFVILLALSGTHLLARDGSRALRAIRATHPSQPASAEAPIRGMDYVLGPVVIAALAVLAEASSPMVPGSQVASAVDDVLFVALALPVGTWVWTYGALLVAIDRLGRRELVVEPFPIDRGLGLLPIGRVPFNGFWLFAVAALLNFVFVARDLVGYAIGLVVLLVVLVALVVSFWRLHVQMASAKTGYLAQARQLLADASEPFRRDPSVAALETQSNRVAAAVAFEKRAQDLLEWPVDERIVTRTVLIATGALAGLIARVVGTQLGT
jgi:hypothetical protein